MPVSLFESTVVLFLETELADLFVLLRPETPVFELFAKVDSS